ncbi:MAG: bifunctional phosphoribosyl-AMP cyclohydrolase/phosphoribosyl-ATP diphosphatase HisIE [Lysobacterales bacterium]|jgi:phosphoribosyl-ATP pyrophosphohydrolase/phosphoribosyl-AMP cyclohydrolase
MLIRGARDIDALDWDKMGGLLPAVVQDGFDGRVLMVAYMNREALAGSLEHGKATFWSRSRQSLWVKGETSGNQLEVVEVHADCDRDCLLVLANPTGPTCHRGTETCFDDPGAVRPVLAFAAALERLIGQREEECPEGSYTTSLFEAGTRRIAQKVGEEGVETALAAAAGSDTEVIDEAADLLYHLLVLLRSRGLTLEDVIANLRDRHDTKQG